MDTIKAKIQEGKIKEALQELIVKAGNTQFEKEIIILNSRYSLNQRNQRLGIIESSEYDLFHNRIIFDMLNLVDQLGAGKGEAEMQGKVKILNRKIAFCESNPLPDRNLMSNVELREIEEILEKGNEKMEIMVKLGLSLDGFIKTINQLQPQVIHITSFSNENGIIFHGKSDEPFQVNNTTFESYFNMIEANVGCIFFNTFVSESLAKNLSDRNIFVIAFNNIIDSNGAIEFATGFYTALSYGKDYPTAFNIGYQTMANGRYKDEVPKLYAYFEGLKVD